MNSLHIIKILNVQFDEFSQNIFSLVSTTTIKIQNQLIILKFPCALLQFISSPISSPWELLISVIIALPFLDCHINEIIQYVFFFVYFLSFSIVLLGVMHIVAYISSLFLFIAEQYAILWMCYNLLSIHQLMNIWVVSSF